MLLLNQRFIQAAAVISKYLLYVTRTVYFMLTFSILFFFFAFFFYSTVTVVLNNNIYNSTGIFNNIVSPLSKYILKCCQLPAIKRGCARAAVNAPSEQQCQLWSCVKGLIPELVIALFLQTASSFAEEREARQLWKAADLQPRPPRPDFHSCGSRH